MCAVCSYLQPASLASSYVLQRRCLQWVLRPCCVSSVLVSRVYSVYSVVTWCVSRVMCQQCDVSTTTADYACCVLRSTVSVHQFSRAVLLLLYYVLLLRLSYNAVISLVLMSVLQQCPPFSFWLLRCLRYLWIVLCACASTLFVSISCMLFSFSLSVTYQLEVGFVSFIVVFSLFMYQQSYSVVNTMLYALWFSIFFSLHVVIRLAAFVVVIFPSWFSDWQICVTSIFLCLFSVCTIHWCVGFMVLC